MNKINHTTPDSSGPGPKAPSPPPIPDDIVDPTTQPAPEPDKQPATDGMPPPMLGQARARDIVRTTRWAGRYSDQNSN